MKYIERVLLNKAARKRNKMHEPKEKKVPGGFKRVGCCKCGAVRCTLHKREDGMYICSDCLKKGKK